MTEYPEHDKVAALNGENQIIGQFCEWLFETYHLGVWKPRYVGGPEEFVSVNPRIDSVIAEYYGLDQNKLEIEKRQMLAVLRGEA